MRSQVFKSMVAFAVRAATRPASRLITHSNQPLLRLCHQLNTQRGLVQLTRGNQLNGQLQTRSAHCTQVLLKLPVRADVAANKKKAKERRHHGKHGCFPKKKRVKGCQDRTKCVCLPGTYKKKKPGCKKEKCKKKMGCGSGHRRPHPDSLAQDIWRRQ